MQHFQFWVFIIPFSCLVKLFFQWNNSLFIISKVTACCIVVISLLTAFGCKYSHNPTRLCPRSIISLRFSYAMLNSTMWTKYATVPFDFDDVVVLSEYNCIMPTNGRFHFSTFSFCILSKAVDFSISEHTSFRSVCHTACREGMCTGCHVPQFVNFYPLQTVWTTRFLVPLVLINGIWYL